MLPLVKKHQNFFFCFFVFSLGHFLIWPGSNIDTYFSVHSYFGCLLFSLLFFSSVISWGRIAQAFILLDGSSIGLDIAFGTSILSFLFAILAHLGFLGVGSQVAYVIAILVGPILADRNGTPLFVRPKFPREGRLVFCFLAIVAFFRLLQALHPWGATDPLFYHLLSARIWFEQGKVQYIPNLNLLFQSRNWEYLYLAVMELASGGSGHGLIEVQIISQCLHCILGFFGSGFLVYEILRATFSKTSAACVYLGCAMAMLTLDMAWMAPIAKNDWGICLWCLTAIFLLPIFHKNRSIARTICCGFFFGITFSAKFVVAATIIGFFLASLFYGIRNKRADFRLHLLIPLTAIAATIPMLFRNWYFTRNPFFPELGSYFGFAQMSETMIQDENKIRAIAQIPFFTNILQSMDYFLRDPRLFCLLLVPLLFWKNKNWQKARFISAAIFIGAVLLFFLQVNQIRYLNASLVLTPALACLYACTAFSALFERFQYVQILVMCSLLAWTAYYSDLLFTKHYGTDIVRDHPLIFAPTDLFVLPNPTLQIRSAHVAGGSKAWLRLHQIKNENILLTGDLGSYYLPEMNVMEVEQDRFWDSRVLKSESLADLAADLHAREVSYILSVEFMYQRQSKMAKLCDAEARKFPDIVVFADRDSKIIDIQKLASHHVRK